jgi:hypothetical protein
MENFVVRFNPSEREAVLDILSTSNDVIINNVTEGSALITIQQDNASLAYETLLQHIDRRLHPNVVSEREPYHTDLAEDSMKTDDNR